MRLRENQPDKHKSHLEVGRIGEVFDNHVRRENANTATVEVQGNVLQEGGTVAGTGAGRQGGRMFVFVLTDYPKLVTSTHHVGGARVLHEMVDGCFRFSPRCEQQLN